MQNIFDKDDLLVSVHRFDEWKAGLDFITSDDEFLQAGTWRYDKGKVLDRHYHNHLPRVSEHTQECVVVLSGSLRVEVFGLTQNAICTFDLKQGDFAVFLRGGHRYEILADDTRILETKNGPFLGVDLDKTRF